MLTVQGNRRRHASDDREGNGGLNEQVSPVSLQKLLAIYFNPPSLGTSHENASNPV